MRAPTEVRPEEPRQAHAAADTLISERFRSYLPGRMLPVLLGKFRDDVAESTLVDDPLLPELLREFRDALVIEQADRARIADELRGKARTS